MPFVQAKCMNCGGILAVDNNLEAAVCPYCNTPYIVEKAINNFNVTNNVNIAPGATVNVYGAAENDFEIEAGVLKKYKGASTKVVIPNNVIEIGFQAFYWQRITEVIIPDTVTYINGSAFQSCLALTSITIPNSVTGIGYKAFAYCSGLTSITIPESIKMIDHNVFEGCTALKRVNINNIEQWCKILFKNYHANPLYYSNHLYMNNSEVKELYIPNNVTSISNLAFDGCSGLLNVIIPESVTSIGYGAFANCISLTSIIIPNSVTSIGADAFYGCINLSSITFNNLSWEGSNICRNCPKLIEINPRSMKKKILPKQQSGCYVATCVYGSYDCPQVWTLRRYRDNKLSLNPFGRAFIKIYYAISPTVVKWFGRNTWFHKLLKKPLDRWVNTLNNNGIENTPYND